MGNNCSSANCAQLCGANANVRDPTAIRYINEAVENALVAKTKNRPGHKNFEEIPRPTPAEEGAAVAYNHTFQEYQEREVEVELYAKKMQAEEEPVFTAFKGPENDDQNQSRTTPRLEARQSSYEDQTQAKTATQLIEARKESVDDQSQQKNSNKHY